MSPNEDAYMHTDAHDQPRSVKPSTKMTHTRDSINESQAHARLLGGFASVIPITLHQAIEIARQLFKADAAGIHLYAQEPGASVPHPDIVCGVLSMHEAAQPSLGRGLCKMSLNAGAAIVLSEQEIELTYLRHVRPRIRHVLMAPIYDSKRRALGTAWLAQITSKLTYSRADALALGRLTHVLAVGMKVHNQANEQEKVPTIVKSEINAQSQGRSDLHAESGQQQFARSLSLEPSRTMIFDELAAQEAHHRVKNTLQIVEGLLSLQARAAKHAETKAALGEASARLRLLTHTHECLYRAASGSQEISVASLLRLVAHALPNSFAETTPGVRLTLTAAEFLMPPGAASTIALIANEVLTNAYKHAFPDRATGTIAIDLERDAESAVILRISDTGTGGGLQVDPQSFGLTLVRRLAEQLGASLTFSRPANKAGTTFTLRVPHKVEGSPSSDQANSFDSPRGVTVERTGAQACAIDSATTATALDRPMVSSN